MAPVCATRCGSCRPTVGRHCVHARHVSWGAPELRSTLDLINQKLGRDTEGVRVGGLKTPQSWKMKRAMLSKRATTSWEKLCEAAA